VSSCLLILGNTVQIAKQKKNAKFVIINNLKNIVTLIWKNLDRF
jgi:hypothetical protein